MSFRSRSRTKQPSLSKCRSWSGSRAQNVASYDAMNSYSSLGTRSTSYYKSGASNNPTLCKSPITGSYSSCRYISASPSITNHNLNGYGNVVSSSKARHPTNSNYTFDGYNRPYAPPNYNNSNTGIASLSLNLGSARTSGSITSKTAAAPSNNLINSNSIKSVNSYLRNFENKILPLRKKKSLLISNHKVDSYTSPNLANDVRTSRSNSLGKYESKSYKRSSCAPSEAKSSFSASSPEKSEGYESGCEPQITSQTGTTVSPAHNYTSSYSTDDKKAREKSESSDIIDYKALWEAATLENEKLKQQLRRKDEEILYAKTTLEKYANNNTKNSLSELEKRERRAMERKLSELEEELKQLEIYKSENQRLKEENGALIRVISKLSK